MERRGRGRTQARQGRERLLARLLAPWDDPGIVITQHFSHHAGRPSSLRDAMIDPHARHRHAAWPLPLTTFVGRQRDIERVCAVLRRDGVRLVTLTGPGGVGKTRLALAVVGELATAFDGGVVFVELALVRAPELVAPAIAQALGRHEAGPGLAQDALAGAIGHAEVLLVLDNFEHVTEAAPLVSQLLRACPRLTVLTTSRAPLHATGEHEYPVLPLPLPDIGAARPEQVTTAPAGRLFIERAEAVDPGFQLTEDNAASVAAICIRLDGLPLAIELAAARCKILPPALLLPRLARQLPLLTGGPRDVPARLQTMRGAIDWSHHLLTSDEQMLFRRLAVFVGGFSLAAAETVCCTIGELLNSPGVPEAKLLDGITSLADKSLLHVSARDEGYLRLGMLEPIREFALEQLEAHGEARVAHAAHAAYFAGLGERLDPNRVQGRERIADRLLRIEADMPNLRVALAHLADTGDADGVLRLAGDLAVFWQLRGLLREGRHWLAWGLAHTDETRTRIRGRGLIGLALIRWAQHELDDAASLAEAGMVIARQINDRELEAFAVHMLGLTATVQQKWDKAELLLEQALELWRALGASGEEAMTLHLLGDNAYGLGGRDRVRAFRDASAAVALFRANGHAAGAGLALCTLAMLARDDRDDQRAAQCYQEALQLWASVQDRWFVTLALAGLAELAAAHGQAAAAARLLGSIDALAAAAGAPLFYRAHVNVERAAVACAAALGDAHAVSFRAAGQRLRLEEAVALALGVSIVDPAIPVIPDLAVAPGPGLTPREREVLRLVVAGRTDRQIAATLFIGHRTVQDHVSHILRKLGVVNRTEAATAAQRDGLV